MAIARGLVNRPPVILADEPTAPLDSERALAVIRILNDMARKFETAIIVVTHDEKIIPTFKRIYHIRDGVTYEEAGEGRAFRMKYNLPARRLNRAVICNIRQNLNAPNNKRRKVYENDPSGSIFYGIFRVFDTLALSAAPGLCPLRYP